MDVWDVAAIDRLASLFRQFRSNALWHYLILFVTTG